MKRAAISGGVLMTLAVALAGCAKRAPEDFQKNLQERLISAKPGEVIALPGASFTWTARCR